MKKKININKYSRYKDKKIIGSYKVLFLIIYLKSSD